jgi:hypothetical protein
LARASSSCLSRSFQSASKTSSIKSSHTFQYFHLLGYFTLQLSAHPTTCQKSLAHLRNLPLFAMTPRVRSDLSSASELLESLSFSKVFRFRLEDLVVLMGENENASPSLAFNGPSIDNMFRRKVIDREASSRRSFG